MVFVTPTTALIAFAIILIISVIVAWYMQSYAQYDKGSFHTFIAVLMGLGVFITFLFYFSVVELQQQEQVLASTQEIERVNEILLNGVLDGIKQASIIIPNFVLSITPLTNTICTSTAPSDPVNAQTCTEKMVLSYRIFDLWQDAIISNSFICSETIAYISNFLQRANSTQLYDQWTVNKLNFIPKTQIFGDLLFKYGLPITIQTPEEYISAAQKLIQDPEYKAIL